MSVWYSEPQKLWILWNDIDGDEEDTSKPSADNKCEVWIVDDLVESFDLSATKTFHWNHKNVKTWVDAGTLEGRDNAQPIPPYSLCAECAYPVFTPDYLCQECRT